MTRIAVIDGGDVALEISRRLRELGHDVVTGGEVVLTADKIRGEPQLLALLDQAVTREENHVREVRARMAAEPEPIPYPGQTRKSKADKLARRRKIEALQNGAFNKKRRRK